MTASSAAKFLNIKIKARIPAAVLCKKLISNEKLTADLTTLARNRCLATVSVIEMTTKIYIQEENKQTNQLKKNKAAFFILDTAAQRWATRAIFHK